MRNRHIYGEPEVTVHWAWQLVGMVIALLGLALAGAWIAEMLA